MAVFSQTDTFDQIDSSSQTNTPDLIAFATQTAPLPFEQTHDDPAQPELPTMPIPSALNALLGDHESDKLMRKLKIRLTDFIRSNPDKPTRFHPPTASLSFDKWIVGYQWARIDNGKEKAVRGVNYVFSDGTKTTYEPFEGSMSDWILVQLKPHQYDKVRKIRVC